MFIFECTFTVHFIYGDIAQLARAPALQAGGQGFDSLYLHHIEVKKSFYKAHWKIYRKKKKYQGKLDIHYWKIIILQLNQKDNKEAMLNIE